MEFLMTLDVESFSITLNRCDLSTGERVYTEGLPLVLDLLSKHDVKATFYFTGEIVELLPESVELVMEHDHEIGCHGYHHTPDKAFDILTYEEQVRELKRAKERIESIAKEIRSFRAPMLRINEDTIRALERTGFKTDSSICSQRFDGPLTFGSRKKLKWLLAPRKPYHPSHSSIIRRGDSKILEIPISAVVVPFIGTTMRVFPNLIKIVKKFIFAESKRTSKPVVFLFHPNECIDGHSSVVTTRRASNIVEYIFADYLRQRLKLKNLGRNAVKLMDGILRDAKDYGFEFLCVDDYRRRFDRDRDFRT